VSAKTILKICWVVVFLWLVVGAIPVLRVERYSLPGNTPLNTRVSPLKMIKIIQLVQEEEEEFPVRYRFVKKSPFGVYSYLEDREVYKSEESFGGLQEISFSAKYEGIYTSYASGPRGTFVGIMSSSPIGVEIRPDSSSVKLYIFLFFAISLIGILIFLEM